MKDFDREALQFLRKVRESCQVLAGAASNYINISVSVQMEEGKGMKQESNGCSSRRVLSFGNVSEIDSHMNLDFGEWFLGRDIEILCKGCYFSGKVIDHTKDFGWYTVRYDDGDTEELHWQELLEFVCPFDVTIPHKTLAPTSRVIRNNKKSIRRSEKNGACSKNLKIETKKTKRN